MLLVCPNCSARYLLSSIALGEEGRDVRCAKCSHEWYQKRDDLIYHEGEVEESAYEEPPEVDEVASEEAVDTHLDEEPIPEGVKPRQEEIQETSNVPAFAEDVLRPKAGLQAKLMGYMAALMIFGFFIAGGFLFKQQIVRLWHPAAVIYELAGVPATFKGEKLVMESLSAKIQKDAEGKDFLSLEGRVINLTNQAQDIPKLSARLRSTNGEDGDSWNIDAPLKTLEPGEAFTFKSEYLAVPRGVGSVNLTFVPTVSL